MLNSDIKVKNFFSFSSSCSFEMSNIICENFGKLINFNNENKII